MTRKEAIFCEKSYIGETNCVDCKYYGTDTCQSRESHKMAIKSLEQEPVLDKIRADIEQYQADCDLSCSDDSNCRTCNNITFGSIYRIIDKYRKGDKE